MSHRIEKINELILQQLSQIIQREFFGHFGIISINAVHTSPDIKNAKVYVSVLDKSESNKIINQLQKKSGYLEHRLIKKLTLRLIPKLEFALDSSIGKVDKIEELLAKIEKEKASK